MDIDDDLPTILVAITGNIVEKYTRGRDLLKINRSGDGEQSQNGDFYYYTDALGSIRTITKTDGTIICRYVYDVYGKPLASETNEQQIWNVFKFTGEYYDSDTELIYLRARWYDLSIGRFLTRDKYKGQFDNPITLHRYIYCGNDPVNWVDPEGELSLVAIGAIILIALLLLAMFEDVIHTSKKIEEEVNIEKGLREGWIVQALPHGYINLRTGEWYGAPEIGESPHYDPPWSGTPEVFPDMTPSFP